MSGFGPEALSNLQAEIEHRQFMPLAAPVWQASSAAVFQPLGDASDLSRRLATLASASAFADHLRVLYAPEADPT
ncbi:hypothetical protein GVY41_00260 [Frigidibacter albus]|uniref:Uncharacterized protein n=1 Tax=Frigidibacter albus TaxID=1465486 RepID=A0A6L8VB18_9RHOB|nr:hypothetical protein [Frigidibacter albus]MZQ87527.1 hypothetical protein [Frigidibacter albus]NBE29433.1 hypothetical protein [Frigidibacter albus]